MTDVQKTTVCVYGDPYCPCQDGDACHYVELPGSPAMKLTAPIQPGADKGDRDDVLAARAADAGTCLASLAKGADMSNREDESGSRVQKTTERRFFLDQDQSSHWYLVPTANRQEWDVWCQLPEDDERSWEAPEFARQINGPHRLTFSRPVEE